MCGAAASNLACAVKTAARFICDFASVGLKLQRDFILFFRLLPSALLLQSQAVIKMLFRAARHVRYKPCYAVGLLAQ